MKLSLLALLPLLLGGCLMPNFTRIIPENKDANVLILSPMYGQIIIQTRVNPSGNNTLRPLKETLPTIEMK